MNVQDMTLAKLAEIDSDGFPYKVHLNCIMNLALQCPDHVRSQNPNQVIFTLSSDLNHQVEYDWEARTLSFYAAFGGVTTQIVIPANNIGAIIDSWDNTVVSFGKLQEERPQVTNVVKESPTQENAIPAQSKNCSIRTLKHLSLVVDNTSK